MNKPVYLLSLCVPLLCGGAARAHIELKSPLPRYADKLVLKSQPCGKGGAADVRTSRTTTFKPGQTITVTWNEYIDHPGHYRIGFSMDGVTFPELPTGPADLVRRTGELVDPVADRSGGDYSQQVTLPSVECDKCALRLVQVMTDKTANGWGNDDFYFSCADLVLKADAAPDMASGAADLASPPDLAAAPDLAPPPSPPAGGCSAAQAAPAPALGAALLLGLGLLFRTWRRRRA